jgi:RNA polymerase sigma-70 factor (ECF subfamily)
VPNDLSPRSLDQHVDRLYRAASAMCRSREDAEDLVQETFARVLSRRRRLDSADATLPYLLTTLRNTHVSTLRTRRCRPQTAELRSDDPRLVASRSASPVAALAAREVFSAIAGLPPAQRQVVTAVDVAGLSYGEAADALAIPVGTVMSRLHRGRTRVAHTVG